MVDIASIGGMVEGLKALTGIAKSAAEAAVDVKIKEAIYDVRQGLYDLQSKALEDQQSRLQLLKEIDELQQQLRRLRSLDEKLAKYQLREVETGRYLYLSDDSHATPHYACPDCFSGGTISILQHVGRNWGKYWSCQKCKFEVSSESAHPGR